jgi:Ca2+-binding EF-hand superfamily protein
LDFFQDFDTLRTGSISKGRFRRCLATLGLSKLGQHDLNDSQFAMLCQQYQDPKKDDQVLYAKFVKDIESGE